MATRRTITRSGGRRGKGRTKAELRRLLKAAQSEVERLLKADNTKTLTPAILKTRLKRLKKDLQKMEPFEGGHT